ncbi:hypothetical protein [Demequina litorisediminis]|uniref:Uncharacterized protein n=1 Tax=Demequina litorisediminis TaxID=1849022 RepID=A0ABQ6IGV6_9MICO|nr:hypothetical protein [Demequina litorisediminis]GMA36406.1 hypothetical protein GCM10025876_26100 [Demequina litorisediminis]
MTEQSGEQAPAAPSPSVLERVRRTPMAPLTAALAVGLVLGLLLSPLVPDDPGALALTVLGAAIAAAVGFTMRTLSRDASWSTLGAAAVAAGLGVHLMAVAGVVGGQNEAPRHDRRRGPKFQRRGACRSRHASAQRGDVAGRTRGWHRGGVGASQGLSVPEAECP